MTLLDQNLPEPASVSVMPVSTRYGIIWGAASVGISLIGFLMGAEVGMPDSPLWSKIVFGIIGFGISIYAVVMAIKQHRDEDAGGFISLGRGMGVGTMVGLIAGAVGAVWMVLYVTVINPEFFNTLSEALVAQWEAQGLSEEQIETAASFSKFTQTTWFTALSQLLGGAFGGFIIGLIAGAIMRRDRPA